MVSWVKIVPSKSLSFTYKWGLNIHGEQTWKCQPNPLPSLLCWWQMIKSRSQKVIYSFHEIPSLFLEGTWKFLFYWDNLKSSILLMNGHCQIPINQKKLLVPNTTRMSYKIRCMDRESTKDSKLSQMYHKCRQARTCYGDFWAHKQSMFWHQLIQMEYKIQEAAQNSH